MKYFFSPVILSTLLIMLSCTKEEHQSVVTGTISGTLTTYDPATPLVTTPAEGIKLWLVDYDYPFDTVTYIGNEQAIVDSTFSDAQGSYNFAGLSFGNYAVAPVPDTAGYRFESTDPVLTLPLSLTEANPDKQVSFSAPWPGGENSNFTIHLTVEDSISTYNTTHYYEYGRQIFIFFIPYISWDCEIYSFDPIHHYGINNTSEISEYYGSFNILGVETNNFLFDFYNEAEELIDSYWITQDLGNTPAQSWWTINLNTHTITQTGKK